MNRESKMIVIFLTNNFSIKSDFSNKQPFHLPTRSHTASISMSNIAPSDDDDDEAPPQANRRNSPFTNHINQVRSWASACGNPRLCSW